MSDLFSGAAQTSETYSASDIEVLEGLEPVRRRPGMYIGGTDETALHHLVAELVDNAMDEAVAGHATRLEVTLGNDGSITVADNGRGIPIDPHPKFPDRSALEVILTTLHSGGKFNGKAYQTSGGLHGVGLSVVNALSDELRVEVARGRRLHTLICHKGRPNGPLQDMGAAPNRRGTTISFRPDFEIFDDGARFRPDRLFRLVRSKAYLFAGVEIRWRCDLPIPSGQNVPEVATITFPGGLADFLAEQVGTRELVGGQSFRGRVTTPDGTSKVEWAIAWPDDQDGFVQSYCNTIPTPQGGTHENGLRTGLVRALKGFAELSGNGKRSASMTAEDVAGAAAILLSVFIPEPHFQGQTKEKLTSADATRLVEGVIKDHLDHWLSADPKAAAAVLEQSIARAEERIRRRSAKDTERKSATRKLRLPGKLTDCSQASSDGTEIFLVEGDSAGGTAKAARRRETQAILPLRGKILNVASASADKLAGNQEIGDLTQALGCGTRDRFDAGRLRYDRVIIMTDADVDGAHIASLLITFFFREMHGLIRGGHLYLAQPPLYRLSQGNNVRYARDEADREHLEATAFNARGKIEVARFKGLGEMSAVQLRETTMDPKTRTLLRIEPGSAEAADLVDRLMGRRPEPRLRFIQERAADAEDIDI